MTFDSQVLADAPVAYFRADEASGTTLVNALGGINGAYSGNPALNQDGWAPLTRRVGFDGLDDFATITTSAVTRVGDRFSIAFLVRQEDSLSPTDMTLVDMGTNMPRVRWSGANKWWTLDVRGLGDDLVHTAEVDDEADHFIVFTKDGSALHAYVDAVEQSTLGVNRTVVNNAASWYIGSTGGTTDFLAGLWEKGALYDYPLSQAQVTVQFNQILGIPGDGAVGVGLANPPSYGSATSDRPGTSGSSYASVVLAQGPVFLLSGGELSGTVAADETGNHPGAYFGVPALGQPGLVPNTTTVGNDGVNDSTEIPHDAALNWGSGPWSLSIIAALGRITGGHMVLLMKGDFSFQLAYDTTADRWRYNVPSVGGDVAYASVQTLDLDLHHIVLTVSGTSIKLYIDAVDRTTLGTYAACVSTSMPLVIGSNQRTSEWFEGRWQMLAGFNYVLSPAQVADQFEAILPQASTGQGFEVTPNYGSAVTATVGVAYGAATTTDISRTIGVGAAVAPAAGVPTTTLGTEATVGVGQPQEVAYGNGITSTQAAVDVVPPSEVVTWIAPDGTQTVLTDNVNIWLGEGSRGFGMPPRDFIADEVPLQPGARVRSVLTKPREVDLPLLIQDSTELALQARLDALYLSFDPGRGDGILRKTRFDGSSRDLFCRYRTGLEIEDDAEHHMATWRRLVLTIIGHDPYWYASSPTVATYQVDDMPALFFPWLPVRVSSSTIFSDALVTNNGDVEAWPVWTITGPGSAIVLRNLTTGVVLTSSISLDAGRVLTIDTRPSRKTLTREDGTNVFNTLGALSGLWPIGRGVTSIRIEMNSAVAGESSVVMSFQPRFLGA